MSSAAQEVHVDVLPPIPHDVYEAPATRAHADRTPFEGFRTFYHPASGAVILGLDWLAFSTDVLSGFLALPVMCVVAFIASFSLIMAIQLKWSKDTMSAALGKSLVGALLVAVPFPVTGTLLGAAILALSGLPHHPVDLVKGLASKSAPAH